MIRSSDTVGAEAHLRSEIVVVGAGPLGIALALELGDAGHSVLLIESGGTRFDPAAQSLSGAASIPGDPWHVEKDLAVRRQLGGTSTLWGGRCVPFDRSDYEPRAVLPKSLWPVSWDEIEPFMAKACEWCECGRPIFDVADLPELGQREMIPGFGPPEVRTTSLERWGLPTRFGPLYGERLASHRMVDVITGLTCVHVSCDDATGAVRRLALRTTDGRPVTAVGEVFVLATGGLEATRLLLASDDVHPGGVGNHAGHLGRWYMAHVEARVAEIEIAGDPAATVYDHERDRDGVYVRRRITFSGDTQTSERLANCAIWFVNPMMGDAEHGSGILSGVYLTLISPIGRFLLAEAIRQAGTKTKGRRRIVAHLRNIIRDLLPAARFAVTFTYERFLRPGRKAPGFFVKSAANVYPLHYHGEHLPHWESQVVLTDEVDALGLRKIRTEMHFSDADIHSVGVAMRQLDSSLRTAGAGKLRFIYEDIDAAVREYLRGSVGYHQTGTTRMASAPENGVVDADLKVFGVENLYVASTSVFPTSSQANPTLTGVAFAVRLAHHLTEVLRRD